MPRRADSFARALKDAEKRLEKALAEQYKANVVLRDLNIEIPRLKATIQVLQQQMNPASPDRVVYRDSKTGQETPPQALSPEDLAKWYSDRDLSNVGSIPPVAPVEPSVEVSEDEMLPDDFAAGKR